MFMDAATTPEGITRLHAASQCRSTDRHGNNCGACGACLRESPLCDACGHGLAEHHLGAIGCVCIDCTLTWVRVSPEERPVVVVAFHQEAA